MKKADESSYWSTTMMTPQHRHHDSDKPLRWSGACGLKTLGAQLSVSKTINDVSNDLIDIQVIDFAYTVATADGETRIYSAVLNKLTWGMRPLVGGDQEQRTRPKAEIRAYQTL